MFWKKYKIVEEDINHGGHVGNERYLLFFEDVRESFLASLGYSESSLGEGAGMIQKSASLEYEKQLFLGEEVSLGILEVRQEKLFLCFDYEVRKENGELAAKGESKMLAYDYEKGRVRRIPKEFLRALEEKIPK